MAQTATKTRTTKRSTTAKRESATPQTASPAPESTMEEAQPQPKCANARVQVAKPQAKMLRKISSIGTHPGKALRIKRWDRYSKGMTLQHCKETEGLDHLDVLFYVEYGLMELAEPTEKEVAAAVKAWEKAKASSAKAA